MLAHRLHTLGVTLALDDVGAGYASLLHLRHLPPQAAKIDRVFVDDIDTSADARHFLGAVLTAGHDLGLYVVVEGVERPTQAEVLRTLGAVHAQGSPLRPPDPSRRDRRPGRHSTATTRPLTATAAGRGRDRRAPRPGRRSAGRGRSLFEPEATSTG